MTGEILFWKRCCVAACGAEFGGGEIGIVSPELLAFIYQAQSDSARLSGNLQLAASLGRDAAFQLGIYEQTRLQAMWENPVLNALVQGGYLFGQISTDIETPIGVIEAPEGPGPWDLDHRFAIAKKAFDFMHDNVFAPGAPGSATMQHYFRSRIDERLRVGGSNGGT